MGNGGWDVRRGREHPRERPSRGSLRGTSSHRARLTQQEAYEFLAAAPPHTGKLATVRADGAPHVAPIWFDIDEGGDIVFMTGAGTAKGRSLTRDPRAALCVDNEKPPFTFVMVEGTVELTDDPGELRSWGTRIAGRYMGPERAETFGARNAVPGEFVVRLRPLKIVGVRDMAD